MCLSLAFLPIFLQSRRFPSGERFPIIERLFYFMTIFRGLLGPCGLLILCDVYILVGALTPTIFRHLAVQMAVALQRAKRAAISSGSSPSTRQLL